jgi:hypothetical protein
MAASAGTGGRPTCLFVALKRGFQGIISFNELALRVQGGFAFRMTTMVSWLVSSRRALVRADPLRPVGMSVPAA